MAKKSYRLIATELLYYGVNVELDDDELEDIEALEEILWDTGPLNSEWRNIEIEEVETEGMIWRKVNKKCL